MSKIKRIAKKYDFYIGIDAGKNTGVAIWISKKKQFHLISTMMIHNALGLILEMWDMNRNILVRVEDARQATWNRKGDAYKAQGAGSVMRDATIWEDFLEELGVDYEMIRPRKVMTKWKAPAFKKLTGFEGTTTEHARDAAMIVYGL